MTRRLSRIVAASLAAALTGAMVLPGSAHADVVRDTQWWLGPLRISQAHAVSRGSGVVVGIIDEPIDESRPELKGKVLAGKGFDSSEPADGRGASDKAHGTEMAGLIAGESPSGQGYLGIAPDAKILPFAAEASSAGISAGLRWLTDKGAKVINISQGGTSSTPAMTAAVEYALSHDVVVVASAGNKNEGNGVLSPANIPGVLAVSAVDKEGDFLEMSSFGPETVLAAPGTEMVAPAPTQVFSTGFGRPTGTSPAAAIVSGVAALVRSKYPKLNAANVIERLIKTSRDNGDPGRDQYFGFGTVRPYQALTAKVAEVGKSSLGAPVKASASASTSAGGSDASAAPPAKNSRSTVFTVLGIALGVVVLVVLLVVLMARKRRRSTAVSSHGPPGGWPQQPGPPQQYGQEIPPQSGPQAPQQVPPQSGRHAPLQYGQQLPLQYGQQLPPEPGPQAPPQHEHPAPPPYGQGSPPR